MEEQNKNTVPAEKKTEEKGGYKLIKKRSSVVMPKAKYDGAESIDYGAGRYDEDSDKVIFNTNDKNQPNVANFVKIIMHEVTHGIRKNEPHTQAQELVCERRGIEIARKLYDQGIIDNFIIYGDENRFADIESLDSTEKTEDFLNYWVKTRYSRLKEK